MSRSSPGHCQRAASLPHWLAAVGRRYLTWSTRPGRRPFAAKFGKLLAFDASLLSSQRLLRITPSLQSEIVRTIRKLLRQRAAGATICPSEVARSLEAVGWRRHLSDVRSVALELAEAGEVVILQRGREVDGRLARGPIRIGQGDMKQSAYVDAYRGIDFRKHPELYRVGRGERGVLVAEPYKSELLPLWRFKDETIARRSALALWKAFTQYRKARDYVGMDMARKFLQMGYTRARRYANHRSGRKYAARDVAKPRAARETLPPSVDAEKARAASIFLAYWQRAEKDRIYAAWRRSVKDSR